MITLFARLHSSSDRIKSFMPPIFPKVHDATNYNGMVIYKVPDTPPPKLSSLPEGVSNMFEEAEEPAKANLIRRLQWLLTQAEILVADNR